MTLWRPRSRSSCVSPAAICAISRISSSETLELIRRAAPIIVAESSQAFWAAVRNGFGKPAGSRRFRVGRGGQRRMSDRGT